MKYFIRYYRTAIVVFIGILFALAGSSTVIAADDEFEIRNGILLKYYGNSVVVDVPDSVKTIGVEAFAGTEVLKVILPSGVTKIDTAAFAECVALIHIELPATLLEIGDRAFEGCTGLYDIQIPDRTEIIGDSAFNYCLELKKVTFPKNLKSIGRAAFESCASIETIELPASLTDIGDHAFASCDVLKQVRLPEGVKSIGRFAFSDCKELTSIQIPATVDAIGAGFLYGTRPSEVFLSDNNPNYRISLGGSFLLSSDGSLLHSNLKDKAEIVNIPSGVKTIGEYAFADYSSMIRVQLPDGLTEIEGGAFFGCSKLASIVIKDKVSQLASGAFAGAISLKSIQIDSENPVYKNSADQRMILSKDESILYAAPSAEGAVVNMPEGLKVIKESAFVACSMLNTILLPESLEVIEKQAFSGCSYLTDVKFPDNLEEIGEYAFDNCGSLSEVYLPAGLVRMHRYAFDFEVIEHIQLLGIKPPVITGDIQPATEEYLKGFHAFALIPKNRTKTYLAFFNDLTNTKITLIEEGDFYLKPGTYKVNIISHNSYEYSMDGKIYQLNPVFKSLIPDKKYTVYMRKQADNGSEQEAAVKKSFRTEAADRYDYEFDFEADLIIEGK